MSIKPCIHTIKSDSTHRTTFLILCGEKAGVKGIQNIALTPIKNESKLIDRQIATINKNYTNSEIILLVGFESRKVINYIYDQKYDNVRILENKNYMNESSIDAWRLGINCSLESNLYIIHGDRIFNNRAIVSQYKNSICTSICHVVKKNYNLGIIYDNNKLINISYGLPHVWSEILYIPQQYYKRIRNKINETKSRKIYTVEKFINFINKDIDVYVDDSTDIKVNPLKEII